MRSRIFVLTTMLLVLMAGTAGGAAFQTLEQGTDDVGRAMVGTISRNDSAATAWYNPAGMTGLVEPQLQSGAMLIVGKSEFDPDSGTTVPGNDGGNAFVNALVPGGLFYVHPIDEKLSVGISAVAPFVGSLDYSKEWVGRYFVQSFDLAVYAAGPAVGYRLTDQLSIGLQAGVVYAKADIKVALNSPGGPGPAPGGDGQLHLDSLDQWTGQWGAGLLWQPREDTRLGISYKAEIDLDDLEGDKTVRAAGGITGDAELALTLPQAVGISLSHDVNEKLTLSTTFGWADFSEFEQLSVELSTAVSPTFKTSFRDTVAWGAAARYQLTPQWTIQSGFSWASSPVSNSNRNPALPFDRQLRYAGGLVYRWSDVIDLGFSYQYLDLGDAKIRAPMKNGDVLSGKYDKNHAHFFALSFQKRF